MLLTWVVHTAGAAWLICTCVSPLAPIPGHIRAEADSPDIQARWHPVPRGAVDPQREQIHLPEIAGTRNPTPAGLRECVTSNRSLRHGLWEASAVHLQRRQWHPTPVLLPGKSHGRRNLVGCSPWGQEESDITERLHFHFSLSCIGEGNGNPLQCSCLENPRDHGAWWAANYGVTQSRTQLKWLSSSSGSCPPLWARVPSFSFSFWHYSPGPFLVNPLGPCQREHKGQQDLGKRAQTRRRESNAGGDVCACVRAQSLSCVQLFATPWTIASQAPLSMEFSKQECCSGLPFPPPGDLPNPGIELASPTSPALAGGFFSTMPPGEPHVLLIKYIRIPIKCRVSIYWFDDLAPKNLVFLATLGDVTFSGPPGCLTPEGTFTP